MVRVNLLRLAVSFEPIRDRHVPFVVRIWRKVFEKWPQRVFALEVDTHDLRGFKATNCFRPGVVLFVNIGVVVACKIGSVLVILIAIIDDLVLRAARRYQSRSGLQCLRLTYCASYLTNGVLKSRIPAVHFEIDKAEFDFALSAGLLISS